MIPFPILPVALAAALASPPPGDPAPVAEAERAFAHLGETEGIGPAFRRFAAPDAILFSPAPAPAHLEGNPPGKLRWWPTYAGIAVSGDLGFTTGPFVFEGKSRRHGHFFTIWRKQPDGSWRWLLDHGIGTAEAPAQGPETPLVRCPEGRPIRISSRAAAEVAAAEAAFARRLAADAPRAYARFLAEDGRLMREKVQPAIGRAAFAPRLAAGPATIASAQLGGAASKAGDLAYTYGSANWQEAGKPIRGYYVRIWQHRPRGWVLLIDETTPAPPPPPPPAPPPPG